jgi:hypothetical protein
MGHRIVDAIIEDGQLMQRQGDFGGAGRGDAKTSI